jgi:hypothetical protein
MNIKISKLKEIVKDVILETENFNGSVDEGFLDKIKQSLRQHVVEPLKGEFKQIFNPQTQQTTQSQASVPPVIGSQPTTQAAQIQTPTTSKKPVFNTAPKTRINRTNEPTLKMMPKGRTIYRPPAIKSPKKPVKRGKQYPKLVRGKQGTYKLEETITEEQLKNLINAVIKETLKV